MNGLGKRLAILACSLLVPSAASADPGRYLGADGRGPTFGRNDPLVVTYYFYWYDAPGDYHVRLNGSDMLTDHPDDSIPAPMGKGGWRRRPPARYSDDPAFSYRDPAWQAREMARMAGAGIDVALPVYWGGDPRRPAEAEWSNRGLEVLDGALEGLERSGVPAPRIGLFYDTTTLAATPGTRAVDLATDAGRDQFYGTIRDFYSRIDPRRWARLDGGAIVWLFDSGRPGRIDPRIFEIARQRFAADFGGARLAFVGDPGWKKAGARTDRTTAWWGLKATADGLQDATDVVTVAPGFSYPPAGRFVDRRGGRTYRSAWESALRSGKRIVAVETWNEFFEATEVTPSFEHGWLYWRLTRQYAAGHHRSVTRPRAG
ncbi:MAG: hypothetical protein U0800_00515 [Isosphaeraceae bacterium]